MCALACIASCWLLVTALCCAATGHDSPKIYLYVLLQNSLTPSALQTDPVLARYLPREKLADLADVFPIFSRAIFLTTFLTASIERQALVVVVIGYTLVAKSSHSINDQRYSGFSLIVMLFHKSEIDRSWEGNLRVFNVRRLRRNRYKCPESIFLFFHFRPNEDSFQNSKSSRNWWNTLTWSWC